MLKHKLTLKWLPVVLVAGLILTACGVRPSSGTNQSGSGVGVVSHLTTVTTVEASGTVEAAQMATLSWKTTGQVKTVNVHTGDHVKAGDVLITLDVTTAPSSVQSAEADLVTARQNLQDLVAPTTQKVSEAEKTLADAHKTLDTARTDLKNAAANVGGAADYEYYDAITTALSDLREAQDDLPLATASITVQAYYRAARLTQNTFNNHQAAQTDYDNHPDSAALQQAAETTDAAYQKALAEKQLLAAGVDRKTADLVDVIVKDEVAFDEAVSNFQVKLEGTNANEYSLTISVAFMKYRAAQEALAQAEKTLYELSVAPATEDVRVAQTKVNVAQANVDALQLTAPFDGEILVLNYQPGDMTETGKAAVTIANRNPLKVNIQVDESEIMAVRVGNSVQATLDILPDEVLTGTVAFVNPVGETISGVVKYTVEVSLPATQHSLLLGATADVTIQTGSPVESLAVPTEAVQSDTNGEFVNKVLANGSVQRVTVVTGEMQGDLVVVTSTDLQAGDSVELVQAVNTVTGGMGFAR
jgi:HlyD family secretion protein